MDELIDDKTANNPINLCVLSSNVPSHYSYEFETGETS